MAEVALRIDNRIFTHWLSVSITRGLSRLAGDFTLGIMMPGQALPDSLRAGGTLALTLDGQPVITGYLDRVSHKMGADAAQVTIKGRDKTGDLVDCSAVYPGGQWRHRTLQQIAQDLCSPFGIAVRWAVSDPEAAKPFTSFTLELSESVADVLSRAARHRGVLVTSDAAGDLVFTQAANTPTDTLRLGDNLLSAEYSEDWRDRYRQYLIKGHGSGGGQAGDANTNALRAAPKGESDDPAMGRYRRKVILADSTLTPATARARALRESRRALAQSERFTAVVKGWQRESGELWQTNQLTRVIAPRLSMVSRDLLISQVQFDLDADNGERTTLTLAPREAFIVPAEAERQASGADGGVDGLVRAWLNQGNKLDE
ncbi:phage baseplate assembly protein [Arsenophonus sp. PmNCSU2021_1]|uniref:phage baseplate assembly protein n=1 Tax=Arsenophonus sp. PmNCSU2021_1 TaxID=3118989 RepID=UPI002FF3BA96